MACKLSESFISIQQTCKAWFIWVKLMYSLSLSKLLETSKDNMKKAEKKTSEGRSCSLDLLFAFEAVLQKSVVTIPFPLLALVCESTHFKPKAWSACVWHSAGLTTSSSHRLYPCSKPHLESTASSLSPTPPYPRAVMMRAYGTYKSASHFLVSPPWLCSSGDQLRVYRDSVLKASKGL